MPLQKFRDKQKIIYWLVAIVVIPSFVLLGFAQILAGKGTGPVIGEIAGEKYNYSEYAEYRNRLFQVNFQRQVYYINDMETYRPAFSEEFSYFISMALTKYAEQYGIEVTDQEISTFIRTQLNYKGNDAKEFSKLVEKAVGTMIRLDSVYEYKKAVQEWLMLKKFLQVLDNTCLVPESFGALKYEQDNSSYKLRTLFVPATKFTQAAQKEIDALGEGELVARAEAYISKNQIDNNRFALPFLWSKPTWKFEYIMVPFAVPGLEPQINDEKLKEFYENNKLTKYADKDGKAKEFAEVRDQVTIDYRNDYRNKTAERTIKGEFSRFLNRMARDSKIDPEKGITVEQINSDPRLVSRGLKAGDSGEGELDVDVIMQNPVFANSIMLKMFFSRLEVELLRAQAQKDQKKYDEILNNYKKFFSGISVGYNADAAKQPIQGKDGLFNIRLVSYTPAKPLTLKGKDGKPDKELLGKIKSELVDELALSKAKTLATEAMAKIREEKVDGLEVKETTMGYYDAIGRYAGITAAAVGQVLEPAVDKRATGYEVVMLVDRTAKKADAKQIDSFAKSLAFGMRGNSVYSPEMMSMPIIKIGHRLNSFYVDKMVSGDLVYTGLPENN